MVAAYFPHAGYGEVEVEKRYAEIGKICRGARREGRKVILGGDFNAVVGQAEAEGPRDVLGKFGLGERNSRGQTLIRWAIEEGFVLANTTYKK